ncbi:MAG: tetratricopeptide repeat protein [Candidatus Latescibacteria bacterium]|nr:tetratricopeptide repeat protein [Candidatus Latescibacterota bacterium]
MYLGIALLFSRKVGRNLTEKSLLLCILLSLGFVVQFFGYVENYALLFPAILTFLLLGLLTLEDKCHIFAFSAFTGVLFPIHFVTFAFIPSYCIVLYLSIIKSDAKKISTYFLKTAFCALLLLGVSALLFTIVNFDILSYLTNPKQSHLLAFNNTTASYSVFAPSHILDLINLMLLLSPFACMVAFFVLPKPKIRVTPQNIFLMSATLFSWALISVANPEIGFFRDWDALSFGSLPLTIFLFYILRDHVTHPNTLARVGTLFITGALFHALLWIGVNAHREKSLNRYEAILKSGSVPSVPAAFSWEAIGIYYRQQNQLPLAHNAYEQAAQSDPHNPRYLNAVGIFYDNKNDTSNALKYFKQAIVQNPKLSEVYLNIGNLFFKNSQYDSAKYYYEQAFNKGLKDAQVYNSLGITCRMLGDEEQAQKWLSLSEENNR